MDYAVLSRVDSVLFEQNDDNLPPAKRKGLGYFAGSNEELPSISSENLSRHRPHFLSGSAEAWEQLGISSQQESERSQQQLQRQQARDETSGRKESGLYRRGILEVLIHNALKGFAVGYGSSAALELAEVLLRARANKGGKVKVTGRIDLLRKGHIQFGAYLGAMLATFNGLMYASRSLRPGTHLAYYRGGVAGAAAGTALLLAPKKTRGYAALLLAIRAAEVITRNRARRLSLPKILSANGDVLLMCAASAPVLYCWVFQPDLLEPSYLKFLNRQSGKDPVVLRSVAAAFRRDLSGNAPLLERLNEQRMRCRPALPPVAAASCSHCEVLHLPNQNCGQHTARYLWEGFVRALPLYAPVHLLPLLLLNAPRLIRRPLPALAASGVSIARSSAFLSSYCTMGWVGLCSWAQLHRRFPAVIPLSEFQAVAAGVLCGLAVLLEKRSRRIELALYTTTQALRAVPMDNRPGRLLRDAGTVPAFSVALGVLMHHYVRHPTCIRPSYLGLMRRFFDAPGGDHKRLLSFRANSTAAEKKKGPEDNEEGPTSRRMELS